MDELNQSYPHPRLKQRREPCLGRGLKPTVFCHSEPLQYLHIHIFYFMLWKQVPHCLIKILTLSCWRMIAVNYTVEKG
jgi:hypothetical protein